MENSLTQISPVTEKCAACYTDVSVEDAYCQHCGYPLKGTETEQKHFLSEREAKEIDFVEAHKAMKTARNALFYIAGATLVSGFVYYAMSKDPEVKNALLIINIILALIYALLGIWSRSKPLAAIISGSALFSLVFILNAIDNPLTILNGIIFKIFIVTYFVKGIKSAIEAEKLKKELNIG